MFFFIEPRFELAFHIPGHKIDLFLFFAEGVTLTLLTSNLHRTRKLALARARALEEEIATRVSIENEFRKNQGIIQFIIDSIPVGISYIDVDQKYVFCNETYSIWYKKQKDTIIGRTVRDIIGDDNYKKVHPYIQLALSGNPSEIEEEIQFYDRKRAVRVNYIPDFFDSHAVKGYITLMTDISELIKQQQAAEAANHAKSNFLANMSHEIRTPLSAVLGFAELLGHVVSKQHPETSTWVAAIKRNGHLLSTIINDILDLSKIEANRLDFEFTDCSLSHIVTDIKSLLSLQASEKGVLLTVNTEGPVPELFITDPLRLRQILVNIVGNAIKFTKQGEVNIKIKSMYDTAGEYKLAFIVKDTGAGINENYKDRIFTPFTQEDASIARNYGGTGLGLPLSRNLARKLGGDVVLVESHVGQGSTFMITINPGPKEKLRFQDLSKSPSLIASPIGSPLSQSTLLSISKNTQKKPLTGLSVLLAEDSYDNQMLFKIILELSGATVEIAANGQEAVSKASEKEYDIILMDLQMPVMDGVQAVSELRQGGYSKPIFALTAATMKEDIDNCLSNGFDDHLSKPINLDTLVERLSISTPD